jgi:predicted permease
MRRLRQFAAKVRGLLRRGKLEAAVKKEIAAHLALIEEDLRKQGFSSEDAKFAARRAFGGVEQARERYRDQLGFVGFEQCWRDARHGVRVLRRNVTFTVTALLTLAIGIGANTAVFSVLNSVLLKPLPYPKPEELVSVSHQAPGAEGLGNVSGGLRLSPSMYFTYAEHNRTLQAFGVWSADTANVTGLAEPEQVRTVSISDGALQALNVPPVLGRWLVGADQQPQGPATVMLSYGYWQRRLGGNQSIIGRKITVDSLPREIAGVMPEGFRFVNADFDLIVPFAFDRSKLRLPGFFLRCVARLGPGVSMAAARADIARLVPIWMNSWPAAPGVDSRIYENWRIAPALQPLKEDVVGNVAKLLWVLMATLGIVMLIACADVANLMLVRAEVRQQEFAIRAALGAGRGRIVRALLLESVLLGLIGGLLGLGLAYAGVRSFVAMSPGTLPRLNEIAVDGRALWFTVFLSLISGALFGLAPALKYAGLRISTNLHGGGRTSSQSRERHRIRNVLVVAQVALAFVLLVSSGLMIRTFQALRKVQPGFVHGEQIQTVRISIPEPLVRERERVIRMQHEIVEKLAIIPGVTSVAFTSEMPMDGISHDWDAVCTEDKRLFGSDIPPLRIFKEISPGLFPTMGTRLIAGRDYTWTDIYGRRPLAIVSENLARELFGTSVAALGKRISTCLPGAPLREVIGVVQDVRDNGVHEVAPAIVYWPSFRESVYTPGQLDVARTVTFAIRSKRAGRQDFLNELTQAIWSVNGSLPLASVRTMQDIYDRSLARTSFALLMLGVAGAMALVLGMIGVYGVISYAVSQRRREIGIRVALGAQHSELIRMFVRVGLVLAGIGVIIGTVGAGAVTRLLKSLLFGITPLDPATYIAVPLVLLMAAALASYLPAARTARVDPVEALKAE